MIGAGIVFLAAGAYAVRSAFRMRGSKSGFDLGELGQWCVGVVLLGIGGLLCGIGLLR